MPSSLRFADVELDLRRYELRRSGRVLKLERIPMDLLVFLVEQRDRLVTREEIIDRIWGKNVFVDTENAINTAIRKIRQALKDDPSNPLILETVPGRGYRFIAQVTASDKAIAAAATGTGSVESAGGPALVDNQQQLISEPRIERALAPALLQRPSPRKLMIAACVLGVMLLLALGLVGWRKFGPTRSPRQTISSLAVLPLENLSGDASQEYFVDGMTDELITELARIGRLRVISRTSVMNYKKTNKSLAQIARELGVDAVIEGTVSRSGNKVRIRAQLIRAEPEEHLWAQSYDSDLNDILAVQSKVAKAIAGELRIKPASPAEPARAGRVNPEAYDSYLRGRYSLSKRTSAGFQHAVTYFQQALDIDPTYAAAQAGLAECYILVAIYGYGSEASFEEARAAAKKALALDATLPEPHAILALIAQNHDWNWEEAEREFKLAMTSNPSYATVHHWYALNLAARGRFEESFHEITLARQLDPLSLVIREAEGFIFWGARRYDLALDKLNRTLEMEPKFALPYADRGLVYEKKGMWKQALADLETARRLDDSPYNVSLLAQAYALAGEKARARKILSELQDRAKHQYVSPLYPALIFAGLGERDQAFSELEKAYLERNTYLLGIKFNPMYDPLRSDPRLADLVRRVGLPP